MRMLGCNASKIDAHDKKITKNLTNKIPNEYSFVNYLSPITDQGSTNMCVTHALACFLNWVTDMKLKTSRKDNNIDLKQIYNARSDKDHDNGMSIKEALSLARTHGIKSNVGTIKIHDFAMIGSEQILKQAILCNGPVLIALPVYDSSRNDFWNGAELEGYHCVAVVGYDKNGFIIRNSWGRSYGRNGYWTLPYSEFNKIKEIWTCI